MSGAVAGYAVPAGGDTGSQALPPVFVARYVSDAVPPVAQLSPAGGQGRAGCDVEVAGTQPLTELTPDTGLLLLGEPGLGKSEALTHLARHWATTGAAAGDPVVVNLEVVTSDTSFETHVSEVLRSRLALRPADGAPVACVLDNVDRCALRPRALIAALTSLFEGIGTDGVRLLMGCRATEWPVGPGDLLEALPVRLETRHLLEFEREQVAELATAMGVEAEAFLRQVERAGAMALARVPLTSTMLVRRFASAKSLPADPAVLFEDALSELAGEWDEEWARTKAARGALKVPAAHRMDLAARIAAFTLVCDRASVTTTYAGHGDQDGVIALHELVDNAAAAGSYGGAGTEVEMLRETLDSALFAGRGGQRRALRHPSIAAYLAARHLTRAGLGEHQLRSVLLGPHAAGARVYPLLREVAAWMAALEPSGFDWLIQADAETIAAHRYAWASSRLRPRLVEAVLELAGLESLRSENLGAFALDQFDHPGLEQQLEHALEHGPAGRARAAIEIAKATGKSALVGPIAAVAGDPLADEYLRARAVRAAAALDAATACALLKPALLGPGAHELPDEVRGALLDLLWPGALTPAELVHALPAPRSPMVFGQYTLFARNLPDRLDDAHLPDILYSAAERYQPRSPADFPQLRPAREFVARLVDRAWNAADRAPVLAPLAAVLRSMLFEHHLVKPPGRIGESEPDTRDRRALLALLIRQAQSEQEVILSAWSPACAHLGLLRAGDGEWMRERELQAATEAEAANWRRLIRLYTATPAPSPEGLDPDEETIVELDDDEPGVNENDADHDGEQARRAKLSGELAALLKAAEQDEPDAFWKLCQCLQFSPDESTRWSWYARGVHSVTDLPGWELLTGNDSRSAARFIDAAEIFVRRHHPRTEVWIDRAAGRSAIAQAGYLAFAHLETTDRQRLDDLDTETWRRWAPALIGHDAPETGASPQGHGTSPLWATRNRLLRILADKAPEAVAEPAVRMVRAAGTQGLVPDGIECWPLIWSQTLAAALADYVEAVPHTPANLNTRAAVEALLLRQRHEPTYARICQRIAEASARPQDLEVIHAGAVLLRSRHEGGWDVVLRTMHQAPAWGMQLIYHLNLDGDTDVLLRQMDDVQIADLVRWLLVHLPPEQDSWEGDPGPAARRHDLEFWRNKVLGSLASRAESATGAMRQLARLIEDNPDRPWLRRLLTQAQEAMIGSTVHALSAQELHALLREPDRRIVRDSADLQELILAELADLQKAMRQGMPPEATFLWDEQRIAKGVSTWQPKREPDLSDYVARHLKYCLERRGVFIDREVEVGRTDPAALGRRIDLLCQVSVRNGRGRLMYQPCRVVIEVKGPWNKQLETGVRDQLVAYMNAAGTAYGIYLVGWYPRHQWDKRDWRYKQAGSRESLEELKTRLKRVTIEESDSARVTIEPFVLNLERLERPSEPDERDQDGPGSA